MNNHDLLGRAAVVTGASRGIGRAVALELATHGADVLIHCRASRQQAEEVSLAVKRLGREATIVQGDLTQLATVNHLIDTAFTWRNSVSIWVNNAGADILTGEYAGLDWESKLTQLWQVDVLGTMRLTRAFARRFTIVDTDLVASVVNVGWDQAESGMEGDSGEMFSAVKGAVMAFTRSAAKSYAPRVRVNAVAPGWIKTSWGQSASGYWQRRACAESLAGRWGTPEDVARVVAWLSSPDAEFVNGQVIPVNGGFRGTFPHGDT